jgi:hypothetical protein
VGDTDYPATQLPLLAVAGSTSQAQAHVRDGMGCLLGKKTGSSRLGREAASWHYTESRARGRWLGRRDGLRSVIGPIRS